jgi:hypothetical protein
MRYQLIEIYFSHRLNNFQNWNCQRFADALHPGRGMKHFTQSSPSSKSTNFDTNLTPIQAAAAIALGFGLEIPAVAAELKIHRSTPTTGPRIPSSSKPSKPPTPNSKNSSAPKSRC